jgi:hypothetical protein
MDIDTFCASRVGYISLILERCTAQTLTFQDYYFKKYYDNFMFT